MAMLLVWGYVAINGVEGSGETDEGWTARLFQLLIILQIPPMAYLIISRRFPIKSAIIIAASQLLAAIGVIVLVLWLESL